VIKHRLTDVDGIHRHDIPAHRIRLSLLALLRCPLFTAVTNDRKCRYARALLRVQRPYIVRFRSATQQQQ